MLRKVLQDFKRCDHVQSDKDFCIIFLGAIFRYHKAQNKWMNT